MLSACEERETWKLPVVQGGTKGYYETGQAGAS